jgi:hypothetical protein
MEGIEAMEANLLDWCRHTHSASIPGFDSSTAAGYGSPDIANGTEMNPDNAC